MNPQRKRIAPHQSPEALVAAAATWKEEEATIEQQDQWVAEIRARRGVGGEAPGREGILRPGPEGAIVRERKPRAKSGLHEVTDPSVKRPGDPEGLEGRDGESEGWDDGQTWQF